MIRLYSLAFHDLRVSEDDRTLRVIDRLFEMYGKPLTVHLVFDQSLADFPGLEKSLRERIAAGELEVVFHGLSHTCPGNIRKYAFYHKYQAEYLEDSEALRGKTLERYEQTALILGDRIGICPPCWIAHRNNKEFFATLRPGFVEGLVTIRYRSRICISPVISLGSPETNELFFLKLLAWLIYLIALVIPGVRVRVAIHPCDLERQDSMAFFRGMIRRLDRKGFQPVLMNDLQRD